MKPIGFVHRTWQPFRQILCSIPYVPIHAFKNSCTKLDSRQVLRIAPHPSSRERATWRTHDFSAGRVTGQVGTSLWNQMIMLSCEPCRGRRKSRQLCGLAKSNGHREHRRIGWIEPQLNSFAKLSICCLRSLEQSKCIDNINPFFHPACSFRKRQAALEKKIKTLARNISPSPVALPHPPPREAGRPKKAMC